MRFVDHRGAFHTFVIAVPSTRVAMAIIVRACGQGSPRSGSMKGLELSRAHRFASQ